MSEQEAFERQDEYEQEASEKRDKHEQEASEEQDELPQRFHASADTFKEIESIIRDYEIKHIVKFSTAGEQRVFNDGHEPWKPVGEKLSTSRLLWGSEDVPFNGRPYIAVARKKYDCQYGKKRKSSTSHMPSCKIDCPARIVVVEVLRLTSPKMEDVATTAYRRKVLNNLYRAQIINYSKGLAHNIEWKREFHALISPLSTHNHLIGEGAAKHQRIDPLLRDRIHQLAASGITTLDVVRDHLAHYVEEELFKGKELPLKTNRRFYPTSKDIHNHVERGKSRQKAKKPTIPSVVESEADIAATTITEEGLIFHDNVNMPRVERYEAVQHYEPQSYQRNQSPSLSTNSQPEQIDVSSFLNTGSKKQSATTTRAISKGTKPTRKDRALGLVRKLYKVTSAIDDERGLTQLTESLISTLMVARSVIPAHKTDVLFEAEPRALLHPRRTRPYKRKETPHRQRYPDINPNAVKLPDKKALKAAELKKRAEAQTLKAQASAQREAIIKEIIMKRKAAASQTNGQPPPKVFVVNTSSTAPVQFKMKRVNVTLPNQTLSAAGSSVQTVILKSSSNQVPKPAIPSSGTTNTRPTPSYSNILPKEACTITECLPSGSPNR